MLSTIESVNSAVNNFIWGVPAMICIIGVGLYLSIRTGFLQIRKFPYAMKVTIGRMLRKRDASDGALTPFQAVCTALAATVGTGNIAGVAGAIAIGGPGAVFWMWISALLGMCTKFSEVTLAVHFHETNAEGDRVGGPMYYIKNGLKKHWHWLAYLFAAFGVLTVFGTGNATQVNTITTAIDSALFNYGIIEKDSVGTLNLIIGIVLAILIGMILLGGIKRIGQVTEKLVPFMAISFIGGSMVILIVNHSAIPGAFAEIFSCAFSKESALGGAAGTAVVSFMTAMRTGVARGVYTNEAGLGSSPIVAAAAKTDSCVKQGLISMTSVFFTTILTCSMTGLVVISSGLLDKTDLSGSVLVTKAYNAGLPFNIGMYLVAVGIIFFSFTTILGWNYYGERCVLYLTGKTGSIKIFKIVYILAIATAPFLTLEPIWLMADITNALMIIPNLIALLGLRKVVISETKKFFDREERTKVNVRKSVVE